MRRIAVLIAGMGIMSCVWAQPASVPAPSTPDVSLAENSELSLKPGEFRWKPDISPAGPITLVISLSEQRLYVYRNGIAIGVSTISSGRRGMETPTGVFSILQKRVKHFSNKYDNAPMPYMQRLTWDGIALHGGSLPGYPASHGCIRLPHAFAQKLYTVTGFDSTTVIVADEQSAPPQVARPGWLAPSVVEGQPKAVPAGLSAFWDDADPQGGPLSLLLSRQDARLFAYRNGQLVGDVPVELDEPDARGLAVFTLLSAPSAGMTLDEARNLQWLTVHLSRPERGQDMLEQVGGARLPDSFVPAILGSLSVGTTLVITDRPVDRQPASSGNMPILADEDAEL
ncbi:L,D-transpeptidase [Laribacter hongkongensis]|uniref:L,D-transpeptidase n=1 Tax=Laribacter hongkongensis TaxID=168471 RepID=UPI0023D84A5A|nr:L,D-transpeptidase [Laribacter hongkongensis]MCG8995661.1 L,D-transpeptidase [Laribacter hongkongensis]MCG9010273.1 L,D-transpeptidase [Laribacter hongkongensis]MCG9023254.1 L,D-transpeptidase [Laribacter hongkongensis]MCG9047033.1 L,D-transpeptidase [Laribacter hongkongensis]MCG9073981.1 L,D-transpeptidase [Laribacter hongkongensis]